MILIFIWKSFTFIKLTIFKSAISLLSNYIWYYIFTFYLFLLLTSIYTLFSSQIDCNLAIRRKWRSIINDINFDLRSTSISIIWTWSRLTIYLLSKLIHHFSVLLILYVTFGSWLVLLLLLKLTIKWHINYILLMILLIKNNILI